MFKIPKQEFTAEFKELAVKRVKSGQSVGTVARELGLVEQTLPNRVKAADCGQLNPPGAKVVTCEQMELSCLRTENAKLRMECLEKPGRFNRTTWRTGPSVSMRKSRRHNAVGLEDEKQREAQPLLDAEINGNQPVE